MHHQSITVDEKDVKIIVSSHYESPSLNRPLSRNSVDKELEHNSKFETSPNELLPTVICAEKPVTVVPIQEINNDAHTNDIGTKTMNDTVTIRNERANRQSNVKKKDNTNVCDVL